MDTSTATAKIAILTAAPGHVLTDGRNFALAVSKGWTIIY